MKVNYCICDFCNEHSVKFSKQWTTETQRYSDRKYYRNGATNGFYHTFKELTCGICAMLLSNEMLLMANSKATFKHSTVQISVGF